MERKQKRIGEILIDMGLITPGQLAEALAEQKNTREFLGAILIKRYLIDEQDLIRALSNQFNIPAIKLDPRSINWNMVREFTPALIFDHRCFPLSQNDYVIRVAITNPLDLWAIKKASDESKGKRLEFVLVTSSDMNDAIEKYRQHLKENM